MKLDEKSIEGQAHPYKKTFKTTHQSFLFDQFDVYNFFARLKFQFQLVPNKKRHIKINLIEK